MKPAISNYFLRHAQNCIGALGAMSRQPIATLLTVAVIGIALAMPAAMSILVQNGSKLAGSWEDVRDFSVYLAPDTSADEADTLRKELAGHEAIGSVRLVTADQALADFQNDPGFSDVLRALDRNPLPHSLIVRPKADAEPDALARLADDVVARANVDMVKLDTEWLARLNAFLDLMRRGVIIAGAMLLIAVIIIVGNTIRLDIQNRRQEIEVSKLLGASNAFVRRPFLYIGFWYGLFGGCFALLFVVAGLLILSGPVTTLVDLYGGGFRPTGLDAATAIAVVTGGLTAGLGGAGSAVARHLAAIQPKV